MLKQNTDDDFSKAQNVRLRNGSLLLNKTLSQSQAVDLYRFRVTNRSSFHASLNRIRGNVKLTLYSSDRRVLATSNELDGLPETIRTQLKTGTYFLKIERKAGIGVIRYRLNSSAFERGGISFAQPLKIESGKSQLKGEFLYQDTLVSTTNRFAFYQFNLSERSIVTSLLEGLRADADIELFNSNRQRIKVSATRGTTSELINQVLDAGLYFVRVRVKEGRTQFKLKCSFNPVGIDLGGNSTSTANPIVIGTTGAIATNVVDDFDPEDYYKVDVASPTNLNLSLKNLTADANLQLLAGDGTVLASSSNTGTTEDKINFSVQAGSYFVRVFPGTSNIAVGYNLELLSSPLRFFGLTDANSLVAFNPDQLTNTVNLNVTGLATGETLKAIDFRPATGQLLGLSSASKLYTIDLATGAATATGSTAITPALTGTALGLDVNPVSDRLRVVSDTDENLQVNLTTGSLIATDTPLKYGTGDPNVAANPTITAAAYTGNAIGALSTTLYGIDTALDRLVRQGDVSGVPLAPSTGTLTTIGATGVDFAANTGFDIFSENGLLNTAYATSGSTLYRVDLATGAATSTGTVITGTTPVNLVGLAIR